MNKFKKWYRLGLVSVLWIFFLTSIRGFGNDLRMLIGAFIITVLMTLFITKITSQKTEQFVPERSVLMGYKCLVCYYDGLYDPPYDLRGIASDEICPCCGFQFGFDDDGLSGQGEKYHDWRKIWISDGCKWFSQGRQAPDGWNPEKQIKPIILGKTVMAKICFLPGEVKNRYTMTYISTPARFEGDPDDSKYGAWSIIATFRGKPDENGCVLTDFTFLFETAPFHLLYPGSKFELCTNKTVAKGEVIGESLETSL